MPYCRTLKIRKHTVQVIQNVRAKHPEVDASLILLQEMVDAAQDKVNNAPADEDEIVPVNNSDSSSGQQIEVQSSREDVAMQEDDISQK